MKKTFDISAECKRIGYLFGFATAEEQNHILKILSQYSCEYPLIYTGPKMKLCETPDESKQLALLLNQFEK